jgi:hypothetical protein
MADTEQPLPETVQQTRMPRPGELTPGWRIVTGVTWLLVLLAMAAVWRTSDQLGLSTWWLGPRGRPNSLVVQLLPFVPAVLMVLASINHVKYVPWYGTAASVLLIVAGLFDLSRVVGLGILEIAIGGAALVVSLVSLSGMYRRASSTQAAASGALTNG